MIKILAVIINIPSINIKGHVDEHILFIFLEYDNPILELIEDNEINNNIKSGFILPIIIYCNEDVSEEKNVVIEFVAITTLLSIFNDNNRGDNNIPPPIPNIVDSIPIQNPELDNKTILCIVGLKLIDG